MEDGIFGTSGGIGFTKQNELFVGRVAMIGFAVGLLCPELNLSFRPSWNAYIYMSYCSYHLVCLILTYTAGFFAGRRYHRKRYLGPA